MLPINNLLQQICRDKMNKKGTSPIIAVVLLIIIVLVIALIVYIYATEEVDETLDTATTFLRSHDFLVESTDLNHTTIRNMDEKIEFDGHTEADFLEVFDVYVNAVFYPPGVIDSFTTANGDTSWDRSEVLIINFNEGNIRKGDLIYLVYKKTATSVPFRVS